MPDSATPNPPTTNLSALNSSRPNTPITRDQSLSETLTESLKKEIEEAAVQFARGAGEILAGYFGKQITVEFKDKEQRDPVTTADKACQEYLTREISQRFPGHGILGEEVDEKKAEGDASPSEPVGASDKAQTDQKDKDDLPSPDFLWVLDPLDGTTNFLNGLPVYASSIGVLHRGWPVAAALYIPWPNPAGGCVLHCHKGGGCFADGVPMAVYDSEEPVPNRLVGLPGSFSQLARFGPKVRSKAGRCAPPEASPTSWP